MYFIPVQSVQTFVNKAVFIRVSCIISNQFIAFMLARSLIPNINIYFIMGYVKSFCRITRFPGLSRIFMFTVRIMMVYY